MAPGNQPIGTRPSSFDFPGLNSITPTAFCVALHTNNRSPDRSNALAFDRSGDRLFVCNATQNAVGVIEFNPGKSKLLGLVPIGWFPGAIVYDNARKSVYVANIKGLSPGRPRKSDGRPEFNSHQYHGSISLLKVPSASELSSLTRAALAN